MLLGQNYSFYEFNCFVELVLTYIDQTLLRIAISSKGYNVTSRLFVFYSAIQTNVELLVAMINASLFVSLNV